VPCTSLFKPVWLDAGVPSTGSAPTGEYDHAALYWRHEALQREIARDYQARIAVIKDAQATFENELTAEVARADNATAQQRRLISENAFRRADEIEEDWYAQIQGMKITRQNTLLYRSAWNKFNAQAKMK